jgi:hypothetical protein
MVMSFFEGFNIEPELGKRQPVAVGFQQRFLPLLNQVGGFWVGLMGRQWG